MNGLHKDRPDSGPLRSINIRKQLIPYKDRPVRICSDHLAGLPVILHSRFMGIFYKIPLHSTGKRLHPWFLIIRYKTIMKPYLTKPLKQFFRTFICRCTMWNNCIVNIKKKPSVSLLKKLLKIDHICRIQIFIWKKTSEHPLHLSFLSSFRNNASFFIALQEEHTSLPEEHSCMQDG